MAVGAVTCLILAALSSIPVNRPSVIIHDPEDEDVPDDYDATLLEGELVGDEYEITLTVAGEIQPGEYLSYIIPVCSYRVGVWVRDFGESRTYVYDLLYVDGREQHYDLLATADGSTLTFEFPLHFLRDGAYIVGLDAVIFGLGTEWDSEDLVSEDSPDDLPIRRFLDQRVDPTWPMMLGMIFGLMTVTFLVYRISLARVRS